MSDHLIAEANRHAMALPTTNPTHADIAWYVREITEIRAHSERVNDANDRLALELAALREDKARLIDALQTLLVPYLEARLSGQPSGVYVQAFRFDKASKALEPRKGTA